MSKHTPGPWRTRQHGDANHHFIVRDNGHWLMVLHQNGEMSSVEQAANARLVAAAPDLLAALEDLVGCIELDQNEMGHHSLDCTYPEEACAYCHAKATIAKTKGE